METFEFEYFDRQRNTVCIGTFVQLNNHPIKKGQLFIVPPFTRYDKVKCPGCAEARENAGHGLPIALYCKGTSDTHVSTENRYGSWAKDLCYIEVDSLQND
jgi:hypothetical protein